MPPDQDSPGLGPPNLLTLLRAFAGPAFVIGGWELIATSYPWGLAVVYGGFAISLAEIIWEPVLLRKPYILQVILIGILLFLVDAFTLGVVLVPAPLMLGTLGSKIDYSFSGAPAPGGIAWHSFFTELDLSMTNPTDGNYDNVDMLVRPDSPVAAIAQLSNLPEVSFENKDGVNNRITSEEVGAGRPPLILSFLATDAGYKVHCNRIPPGSSLTLVMAIVQVKKSSRIFESGVPIPNINALSLDDVIVHETLSNKDGTFSYWFGSQNNVSLYMPKPQPKKVLVSGYYTSGNRRRGITKEVSVWWGKDDGR